VTLKKSNSLGRKIQQLGALVEFIEKNFDNVWENSDPDYTNRLAELENEAVLLHEEIEVEFKEINRRRIL